MQNKILEEPCDTKFQNFFFSILWLCKWCQLVILIFSYQNLILDMGKGKGFAVSFDLNISTIVSENVLYVQVFVLRKASEEPRGHPAAIMTQVLVDAECKGIINASQKKILLEQLALNLSWFQCLNPILDHPSLYNPPTQFLSHLDHKEDFVLIKIPLSASATSVGVLNQWESSTRTNWGRSICNRCCERFDGSSSLLDLLCSIFLLVHDIMKRINVSPILVQVSLCSFEILS